MSTRTLLFTECVNLAGSACKPFSGTKKYVSTGAVDVDHINEADTEIVDYEGKPSRANLEAVPGDVLFAKMQDTKKNLMIDSALADHIYSTGFCAVRAKDGVLTDRCLYHLLTSETFLSQKDKNCSGAIQKAITNAGLSKITIQVPNIEEQGDIANQLDAIIGIIAKRQQELTALDDLIKARFVEMFGSINNNAFGFPIYALQDVCEQIRDGTHQTPEYTDDVVNGYKFLSSKDVTTGKIDWHHLKYIPESLHNELYARIAPRKGDILLAKNGTTGIAAIVDTDDVFDIYVSLALLRPIGVHPVYLWAAINSTETKRQFNSSLKGIGVPNLHLGEIRKARILIPPKELQEQFAVFVAQVDKSKVAVRKALDEAQLLFNSLMQQYFG